MAVADLPTVTIKGRHILRVGKWNGRVYTLADLDNIVESFDALRGEYDPPMKLGHNKNQELLASDGLPAAGWVSALRREGSSLIADIRNVPAKLASVIKAGGYNKVSSEIMFNCRIGDKVHPAVLRAVSWLGADPPAVSGLSDVYEMYAQESSKELAGEFETVTLSIEDGNATGPTIGSTINSEVYEAITDFVEQKLEYGEITVDEAAAITGMITGVMSNITAGLGDLATRPCMTYMDDQSTDSMSVALKATTLQDDIAALVARISEEAKGQKGAPAARTYLASVAEKIGKMKFPDPSESESEDSGSDGKENVANNSLKEGEIMQDEKLRELLGLSADADAAAIEAEMLSRNAELIRIRATSVELSDHQALVAKVEELTLREKTRDAEVVVDTAISDGKLLPKQRPWAIKYCLSAKDEFATFIADQPKVIDFSTRGSSEGEDDDKIVVLSDTTRKIATVMGNSEEALADTRTTAEKLAAMRKAQ